MHRQDAAVRKLGPDFFAAGLLRWHEGIANHLSGGHILDNLSTLIRPEDFQRDWSLVTSQSKMQPTVILIPLAGTRLDLARINLISDLDAHLRPNRRTIHRSAIAS